jgi:hypothetical protein
MMEGPIGRTVEIREDWERKPCTVATRRMCNETEGGKARDFGRTTKGR